MEGNGQDGGSPGRNAQLMLQMMTQMSEQLHALRAEREDDREAVQAQIQALQSAIATPTSTPQPPVVRPEPRRPNSGDKTTRRKPVLPDPPKFNGTRKNFRPWYLEMRAKLSLDGHSFGNDQELFAYIYARLEGTAQNMAAAYFEQGAADGGQTAEQFLDYLDKRYGDPNATARALDRLRELKQRPNESFASFLPKFEKELADSGGASWNDTVQINYLNGALNDKLVDRLISVPNLPKDFNGFTELLLTIGSRLDSQISQIRQNEKYQGEQKPKRQRAPWQNTKEPTADAMDWERTRVSSAKSKQDAKWVSDKELQERRERRVCLRCGRKGHFIRQCNLGPAVPPIRVSRTRVKITEEDLEDPEDLEDLEDSDYSGKE
jgi:hypothetical protein